MTIIFDAKRFKGLPLVVVRLKENIILSENDIIIDRKRRKFKIVGNRRYDITSKRYMYEAEIIND